uniref:Uncharacterized protein n=1 Tax=Acanthochromis polyacanthus TaxID=80966 RepID=A0A3Q1GFY3_9TELE
MTMVTDALASASLCNKMQRLTDRTSVSVTFQKVFQKWTSKFWVMRSYSAPLNSGSMAYFPELNRELAATPGNVRKVDIMRKGYNGKEISETE